LARRWWLMPVILTTWESEIGRFKVQDQLGQAVPEISVPKITRKKWTGGVPKAEFKLESHQK
jgi:hypothetical protein